ncbi:protein FAM166B-like [Limulus polyphemus]|uniref:Protein FAM166B-like n=1 Tax=Limulus polyphemus TaxID=6850 RepID=A0ABM1BG59_LIMPO|nr:protein FAM166B-like [Limulus polyphemus]
MSSGAHIPGYTGYVPGIRKYIGQPYGKATTFAFRGRYGKHSPLTQSYDNLNTGAPSSGMPVRTVAGYTGHLPGRRFLMGRSFRQELEILTPSLQNRSERNSENLQKWRSEPDMLSKQLTLGITPVHRFNNSGELEKKLDKIIDLLENIPPESRVMDSPLVLSESKNDQVLNHSTNLPSNSSYQSVTAVGDVESVNIFEQDLLWNRIPSTYKKGVKTYIPGYQGYVPNFRSSTASLGVTYARAAAALNNIRDFNSQKNKNTTPRLETFNVQDGERENDGN